MSRLRRGQAATEYLVVFVGMLIVATVLWHFCRATVRAADRTERLVSSEYP